MIIHLNIKNLDAPLIEAYIEDVLKYVCGYADKQLAIRLSETVNQYHELLTKVTIDTFEQSDMIRSVRLGCVALMYKTSQKKYSDIQWLNNISSNDEDSTDINSLIKNNSFLNANIFGQLADEKNGYIQMKFFLLNKLTERLDSVIKNSEHKLEVLERLFLAEKLNGKDNPILFTLDEMKTALEKYVFEILKSSILDVEVFELACHGVSKNPKKNTDDVHPFMVVQNYLTILAKYKLLNTNGENNRYFSALKKWALDNPNKLIFLRDYAQNDYDCLDLNFFSLNEIVLKNAYNLPNLIKLLPKQVFSDSGVWRAFLLADPIQLSRILKVLRANQSDQPNDFNKNLHIDAFLLQFTLKQKLDRFDVAQIDFIMGKAKFLPMMLNILSKLHPVDYALANRSFGIMLDTMWVNKDDYLIIQPKTIAESFAQSEFPNVLDYLSDLHYNPFSTRFTVKSLIRHSAKWHNSTEQQKKRVFTFEYPEINYDVLFVRFEAIRNSDELKDEIETMLHCVSSYSDLMASQKYIVFRFIDEKNDVRGTVGLSISGYISGDNIQDSYHIYKFDQMCGPKNTLLPSYAHNACECLIANLMKDQPLVHLLIEKHQNNRTSE